MKNAVIVIGSVLAVATLLFLFANKWNDYFLPYSNVDIASKDFLDIDTVQNYELIKHYADTIQYHLFRKPIPVFLVDIIYESNVYEEKKMHEIEKRNTNFEFEIGDFRGMVISESNEKMMKAICFCDESKTVRYIAIYYKDFSDCYDDINSFESELDVCLYGIGCKWNATDMKDENPEETIPENIIWQKSKHNTQGDGSPS